MTAPTVARVNDNGAPNRVQICISGTYTAETDVYDSNGVVLDGAGNLVVSLGFVPSYVKVFNLTDRLSQEWFKGMNQGDFIESVAAGDKTLETDDQIIVTAATTGSAPVTYEPTATLTVNCGGGAMTDNDTVIIIAEG